jgi:hypothetical protein
LLQAAQALAEVATAHTGAQRTNTAQLSATLEEGGAQSKEALDAIWYDLAKVYEPLRQLESTWNELAARVSDHDAGS